VTDRLSGPPPLGSPIGGVEPAPLALATSVHSGVPTVGATSGGLLPPVSRRPKAAPKGLGALAAFIGFALLKAKSLLMLLKALPAAKFLLTSLSMLAMVWFEAQRSGLWFGVGFVLMILVHELGHGYAMKKQGVSAGWPIFIPFIGAMIAMKGPLRDRDAEAHVAFGGPLAGTAIALAAAALGLLAGSRLFMALAYTGFFLNLFNLTPLSPLDGGRVAQAFSRRAWVFGLVLLVGLFLVTHSPQLLLIAALALPRLFGKQRSGEQEREVLSPGLQRTWAVRYFGLTAFLGIALYLSGSVLAVF
jgi:Zn-dependent protease